MNDLIEDVLVARTPEDMRQALDDLYAIFSDQIDDEKIVENIDDDHERFTQLTIALLRLGAACKHAKSLLIDTNAAIAVPLVRDLIMACVATSSFTASLSPAALELVKARRTAKARMAVARAAKPSMRHAVDRAVEQARQRWLDSGKALPRSFNNFAQRIADEVNRAVVAGGGDPVGESAIAKRLQKLATTEAPREPAADEDLFG